MNLKNNKKGFTLIELLAVIVILGLLMAIAIPSITRYITQSRKKTLVTTIENYIGSVTNQVNAMEYSFTNSKNIYAVPIECISVERGGKNPFGEWMAASNAYWAYVLVQYDEISSSYIYGFTFKDSAGYGLYPTSQEKLLASGEQIQTGLNLKKPENGFYTNIAAKENWQGFKINDDTQVVILKGAEKGNGSTTCTICQKANNSSDVESEKEAFAIYSADDKSLTFVRASKDEIGSTYNGKAVTKLYGGKDANQEFEKIAYDEWSTALWYEYSGTITSVIFEDEISPISIANWFKDFFNCHTFNVENLNTSNVKNMIAAFQGAGTYATNFKIIGMEDWKTSKVENMSYMFNTAGMGATTFDISDISGWDTSKVTDMTGMFYAAGMNATYSLDLTGWDVSNVKSKANFNTASKVTSPF